MTVKGFLYLYKALRVHSATNNWYMAKATKPKKAAKKRASKYDEKLQINGTFEQLVKELITPKQPSKKSK